MRRLHNFKLVIVVTVCVAAVAQTAVAFEGRINAVMTQGNETNTLLYTVGTNFVRVAMTSTNWPHPVDIVDLNSGALTLLFPHNRSFVRLRGSGVPAANGLPESAAPVSPQAGTLAPPGLPALPSGIGPQSSNLPASPSSISPMPAMPPMPMMPVPPTEKAEFKATGETTNILGFTCIGYDLKQRGETMEVWATDKLLPFQPYVRNQSPRFGPRMIEEQWPKLLTERKLFPLLVSLHYDSGAERLRFEVKSITPEKITDPGGKLFQPPPDYHEIEPLPF